MQTRNNWYVWHLHRNDIYIKSIMLYFCVLNHRKKEDKQGT